jgi:transcriptional regulator with GAF, ATPase, and Fis domain
MIPEEVRKAALEAYKRGIKPAEICNVMKISYTSLCRFRTQERNEGTLKQRPRTRSDASLEKDKQITELYLADPDTYYCEAAKTLGISKTQIFNRLKRLGFKRKKNRKFMLKPAQ